MGRGQRGVAAQVHLDLRCEPSQVVHARAAGEEGGLREVELGSHRLHPTLVAEAITGGCRAQTNGGRVPGERTICERVDNEGLHAAQSAAADSATQPSMPSADA